MNGQPYYELYMACPICTNRRQCDAATYWKQSSCGGKIYVGDNANFYCEKCGERKHWSNCRFHHCHINESKVVINEITFESPSVSFAEAISISGDLVIAAGLPWLTKLFHNIER